MQKKSLSVSVTCRLVVFLPQNKVCTALGKNMIFGKLAKNKDCAHNVSDTFENVLSFGNLILNSSQCI